MADKWVLNLIHAALVIDAKLGPGRMPPNWQDRRALHDALEDIPPEYRPDQADIDDAEGERRFTLPINPDPVTTRLRAEQSAKSKASKRK